jgi:hypothetical protein
VLPALKTCFAYFGSASNIAKNSAGKADRLKAGYFNLVMETKKGHTKKLSKVKKYFSKTQAYRANR